MLPIFLFSPLFPFSSQNPLSVVCLTLLIPFCIYYFFQYILFTLPLLLMFRFHLSFEVITIMNMKITMFYDVTSCLVERCQSFEGTCCLNLFFRDGDSNILRNVGIFLPDSSSSQPQQVIIRCTSFFFAYIFLLANSLFSQDPILVCHFVFVLYCPHFLKILHLHLASRSRMVELYLHCLILLLG
jgi:hypothetical protein